MSAFFLGHPKETDLALFAGGESGPFARWRIERHVEQCPQCQEATADFFRLPDQLNELAELPNVDWKRMAAAIESGVRADAAANRQATRTGIRPVMWQAGLVAATVAVGVIVLRSPEQPQAEPELIALAPVAAPAQVAQEAALEVREQDAATAEPARISPPVEAAAPLAKAREERQAFAEDIAAPAAPPPPPQPVVVAEATSRRAAAETEAVAPAAESAEGRLRSDAAARVGAVATLGASAQSAAGDAATMRQGNFAATRLLVETVNFDESPIGLSGAFTTSMGAIVRTPSVTARNRSDRMVTSFELVWTVSDADASAWARIERHGAAMAPGSTTSGGGERSWRLPANVASPRMRIYVTRVAFDDGTTWMPTAGEMHSRGLVEPGAAHPQMELLPDGQP